MCTLTGHELPARVADLVAYTSTKGFLKAQNLAHDYAAYAPHVVPLDGDSYVLLACLLAF